MKRVRLVILAGLVIAALTMAVLPSLAADPFDAGNWSFEADNNSDGQPDKWNVKGDVVYLCDHGYPASDDCMMVFLPSNKAAAVWQRFDGEHKITVVTEEGSKENLGNAQFMAKQLDSYRAHFGYQIVYPDGTTILLYDYFPGGTYGVRSQVFYDYVSGWGKTLEEDLFNGNVEHLSWGVLTLPGDGYLGVDWVWSILAIL